MLKQIKSLASKKYCRLRYNLNFNILKAVAIELYPFSFIILNKSLEAHKISWAVPIYNSGPPRDTSANLNIL